MMWRLIRDFFLIPWAIDQLRREVEWRHADNKHRVMLRQWLCESRDAISLEEVKITEHGDEIEEAWDGLDRWLDACKVPLSRVDEFDKVSVTSVLLNLSILESE